MKNLNLKRALNLRSLTLVAIFAVALFAVSCDKASDDYVPTQAELETKSAEKSKAAPKKGDATIAEIVVASTEASEPQFTLLLAALEYAGLTDVFAGGDQYTVFAPTDQAFIDLVVATGVDPNDPFTAIDAALGEGTVANVLLYHVTDGRRAANSVVPKNGTRTIETLLGATFDVNPDLSIDAVGNSANIIGANISASNGIIHVIDTVILPVEL
ncbi:fasciclin domain-containing protein [Maribellus mangrovi]|uniref:fasciclin domain-containing protein n=1 Tax=Maribellus mangrovi TaxID=3133146 RepID=UPI0030EF20B5